MAKLHHSTLKAAVNKYAGLHAKGQTSEEVKATIKEDEKGFDEDGINEIYEAIVAGNDTNDKGNEDSQKDQPKAKKAERHVVATSFRDKHNFDKQWKEGDDVSHFDKGRLDHLKSRKLVKVL